MRLFTILFILAIITSCATINPISNIEFEVRTEFSEKENSSSINGFVLDKNTSVPILFCTISLYSIEGDLVTGTDSDMEGNFSIPNLPAGEYYLEPTYVGYKTEKTTKFILEKGETKHFTLRMNLSYDYSENIICGPFYKIPLIKMDETTSGATFTSDQIKKMAW